jgi:hypothetical protein
MWLETLQVQKHTHYHSDIHVLGSEDYDTVPWPISYYQINISNTNFRERLTTTRQSPPS